MGFVPLSREEYEFNGRKAQRKLTFPRDKVMNAMFPDMPVEQRISTPEEGNMDFIIKKSIAERTWIHIPLRGHGSLGGT